MRVKIYTAILVVFLFILLSGLASIQIVKSDRYRTMSEQNRLKVVPLLAPRGCIFDRNGTPMVKDVLRFDASVIYSRVRDKKLMVNTLSRVLDVPEYKITEGIKRARRMPFSPVTVVGDIGIEKAVHLEEMTGDLRGLLVNVSSKREYLKGKAAANVLGYLGLINRSEFDKLKHYGYQINDLIGRSGLEKQYDDYLRGTHGGKQIEVDHRGREVGILGYKEPVPGRDLYLTIDLELQEFCDSLLDGQRGAIIAMDPQSGEILAMANAPSFDPSIFVDRKRRSEVSDVLKDPEYPMMNRAISGAYPPGSVFKAIVGVAALDKNVISNATAFNCPGSLQLGRRAFHCWKRSGHGEQNLKEALKNSCNVYFWRVGLLLGVDMIAGYAKKFGIGQGSGIDLPGEAVGNLPSREWKKKRFNDRWYRGETLNYSVGQGYLLCTPLQVVRFMSVFANGGYLVRPYIVEEVGGVPVNEPRKEFLEIDPSAMESVREGLRKVVNDRRGTGMKARLRNVVVAGKTGTAQTSRGKNHGWFAGFAPYDDAKLAVVVFDEYGGKGGYYAAATAGDVFRKAEDLGLLDR